MKLLLDENLPAAIKSDLNEHEVYTVSELKWSGIRNGELLKLMLAENFDALITADKNLEYQQNFKTYPIAVLVLMERRNNYERLKRLLPALKLVLKGSLRAGPTHIEAD